MRSEPLKIAETQSGVDGLLPLSGMARASERQSPGHDRDRATLQGMKRNCHRQPQLFALQAHGTDISLQKHPAGHPSRAQLGTRLDNKTAGRGDLSHVRRLLRGRIETVALRCKIEG